MNMFNYFPKTIYTGTSPISGEIKIIQRGDTTELFVKGVKQSIWSDEFNNLRDTYWDIAATIPYDLPSKKPEILMFGMGAATTPKLLTKIYTGSHITCVELDQEIIDVANKFFSLKNYPQIDTICEEAIKWIKENHQNKKNIYDVIYLDTFLGEIFSVNIQDDILIAVKGMLKQNGILIANRIYVPKYRKEVDEYLERVSKIFPDKKTKIIPGYSGSDNIVVYAKNTTSSL